MFVYVHQICMLWVYCIYCCVAFTVVAFLTVVTGKTRSGKENRLRCSSQFPIPRRDDQVSGYLRNEIY